VDKKTFLFASSSCLHHTSADHGLGSQLW